MERWKWQVERWDGGMVEFKGGEVGWWDGGRWKGGEMGLYVVRCGGGR